MNVKNRDWEWLYCLTDRHSHSIHALLLLVEAAMKGTYVFEEKYSQIISLVLQHSVDCVERMKGIAKYCYSRSCQGAHSSMAMRQIYSRRSEDLISIRRCIIRVMRFLLAKRCAHSHCSADILPSSLTLTHIRLSSLILRCQRMQGKATD